VGQTKAQLPQAMQGWRPVPTRSGFTAPGDRGIGAIGMAAATSRTRASDLSPSVAGAESTAPESLTAGSPRDDECGLAGDLGEYEVGALEDVGPVPIGTQKQVGANDVQRRAMVRSLCRSADRLGQHLPRQDRRRAPEEGRRVGRFLDHRRPGKPMCHSPVR
jgi:hypothetical protein